MSNHKLKEGSVPSRVLDITSDGGWYDVYDLAPLIGLSPPLLSTRLWDMNQRGLLEMEHKEEEGKYSNHRHYRRADK